MSGYKAGYSEPRSPFYADGRADGEADAAMVAADKDPAGMDPAKSWSVMYRRGYQDGLGG